MAAGDATTAITSNNARACAVFDGVDDSIQTLRDMGNYEYTFSLWFKSNDFSSEQTFLRNTTANYPAMSVRTDRKVLIRSEIENYRYSNAGVIPLGEWVHLIIYYAEDPNNTKIYVNNVDETGNVQDTNPANTWHLNRIGNSNLHGQIADIQIHNKALSEAERTKVYQGSPVTDGLVAHWKLGKDYKDSVGSNDGTNSGSRLAIIDDEIAAQIKSQRTTSNDNYMLAGLPGGQVVSTVVEEA